MEDALHCIENTDSTSYYGIIFQITAVATRIVFEKKGYVFACSFLCCQANKIINQLVD